MILDGWGKSPDPKVSAIDNANTPFIDSLYTKFPNAQLRTDGLHVGLPEGQMGNSEVGHMNLGAGRIVYQDLAVFQLTEDIKKLFQDAKTVLEYLNLTGLRFTLEVNLNTVKRSSASLKELNKRATAANCQI